MKDFFTNKTVLITGGAGFLGSNIAHKLAPMGAKLLILDSFDPSYGGNEYNFKGIESKIELIRGNITDRPLMESLCSKADVIFHLAAQCSHVDSMTDPWFDLEYNCVGTLSVLEGAKKSAKKPVIVYAGTRAILGAPLEMPTREKTLPNPTDIYGVNKHAAELYGSVYARVYRVPFVSMRLTNSYGPRHQMKNGKYGILNWFMSEAMQGRNIRIFGTGEQLRDYIYIDDAVDAFLKAAVFAKELGLGQRKEPKVQLSGESVPYAVFNIGSGAGKKFADCAKTLVEFSGGKLDFVPWPADRKAIETGDFIADGTAAKEVLGWQPKVSFEEGLKTTVDYYRNHLKHYL